MFAFREITFLQTLNLTYFLENYIYTSKMCLKYFFYVEAPLLIGMGTYLILHLSCFILYFIFALQGCLLQKCPERILTVRNWSGF